MPKSKYKKAIKKIASVARPQTSWIEKLAARVKVVLDKEKKVNEKIAASRKGQKTVKEIREARERGRRGK